MAVAAIAFACSGGASDLVGGGKKDKSGDSERDSGSSEDESTPSTAPVEVSGAFLTADCDIARDDAPPAQPNEEVIGCVVVDKDSHERTGKRAKIYSLSLVQADRSRVEAQLAPAQTAAPWHTYGRVPAGSMEKAVAIEADIEVDGARGATVNWEPRVFTKDPARLDRSLRRVKLAITKGGGEGATQNDLADGDPKTSWTAPAKSGDLEFSLASLGTTTRDLRDVLVVVQDGTEATFEIKTLSDDATVDSCKLDTARDRYRRRLWCDVKGAATGLSIKYTSKNGKNPVLLDVVVGTADE
jgi:hypothetical protein